MAKTSEPVQIGSYLYSCKTDHRDGTASKSQWTVSIEAEHSCFALGIDSDWIGGSCAWGLHLVDGAAAYLGRTAPERDPSADLFVAFFQLSETSHGYPSDPKRSIREVPPESVRGDWLSKGYVRPSVIRKLGRGLTCSL
jgi:hypothetical protein